MLRPTRDARISLSRYVNGSHAGVRNFPDPAIVTWRSADGTERHAVIDIRDIFKARQYLHNVCPKDLRENAYLVNPDIILVVDDRTISVYMDSYIPIKDSPACSASESRNPNQIIRAFYRSY